ncbi:MAG TPA: hypothetical protein VF590_16670, partial [Isosphaeraceae bacterium]
SLLAAITAAKSIDYLRPAANRDPKLATKALEKKGFGQMFGVLVCLNEKGEKVVLKAFSGVFDSTDIMQVDGWCPPVPAGDPAAEQEISDRLQGRLKQHDETLARLDALRKEKPEKLDLEDAFGEIDEKLGQELPGLIKDAHVAVAQAQAALAGITETHPEANFYQEEAALIREIAGDLTRIQSPADLSRAHGRLEQVCIGIGQKSDNAFMKTEPSGGSSSRKKVPKDEQSGTIYKALAGNVYTPLNSIQRSFGKFLKNCQALAVARIEKEAKSQAAKIEEDFANLKDHRLQTRSLLNPRTGAQHPKTIWEVCCPEDEEARQFLGSERLGLCAAPKLLCEAMRQGLVPVALAEVWIGGSIEDKDTKTTRMKEGDLVASCDYCRLIMGFMLCGLLERQQDLNLGLEQVAPGVGTPSEGTNS